MHKLCICLNYTDVEIVDLVCLPWAYTGSRGQFSFAGPKLSAPGALPTCGAHKVTLNNLFFNLRSTSSLWNVGTGDTVCLTLPNP